MFDCGRNRVLSAVSLALCGLSFGAHAFADDAFVLPVGVFRFTAATTTVSGTQEYDANGNKVNVGAAVGPGVSNIGKALNLATGNTFPGASWNQLSPMMDAKVSVLRQDLAFEYGLTDSISVSLQLPTYLGADVTVTRNADLTSALTALNMTGAPTAGSGKLGELFGKLSSNGKKAGTLGDMILGAKYQFLHSGSLPYSREANTYRAAIAAGFSPPTGSIASPDTTDVSTTTLADTKAWGMGIRTYWDYQFASWLYLNFHTQHEYRFSGSRKYLAVNQTALTYQVLDTQFRPGLFNHLELDLAVTPEIISDLKSESGVVVTGDFVGQGKYTEAPAAASSLVGTTTDATRTVRVTPYLGAFYTGSPLPLKFRTFYYVPASGKGTKILDGLTFNLQAYLRF